MNVACITVGTTNQKLAEEWINLHLVRALHARLCRARSTTRRPSRASTSRTISSRKLVLGEEAQKLVDFDWDVVIRSQPQWSSRFNREIAG